MVTPAGFEHFFEDAGILPDNISTFRPPVDYQFDENRMSQIARNYGQIKWILFSFLAGIENLINNESIASDG